MTDNPPNKYTVGQGDIDACSACEKGMICLENGPSCKIGAMINKSILIVDCKNNDSSCPFFNMNGSARSGDRRGACTCRVRLALHTEYGL